MIDPHNPDYTNTPASGRRPEFHYHPGGFSAPVISIITAYYNTGPIFQETVRSIQGISFTQWEWVIVDDGSNDADSLVQLASFQASEPRVRVLHRAHAGPSAARNRAAAEASGRYLLQLDSDDLIEPTFVEKALWVLETQPQFAACGAYNVTFGTQELLWAHGFQEYEQNLKENMITHQAVIRRDAFLKAGGYDETLVRGHEDWDFWLNLAEVGEWGYTIPEYLTWYRTQDRSRILDTEGDRRSAQAFRSWLWKKHSALRQRFPHPQWGAGSASCAAEMCEDIPLSNPLAKPAHITRILLLVPWLTIGGADKFNLDLVTSLSKHGYECTIVSTLRSDNPWFPEFTLATPDIFCLHQFLDPWDYPRFLRYLIESRQIDAILISNSELAFALVPYLRAHYPHLAMLDYTHLEEEQRQDGGYPGIAVALGHHLDLHLTATQHLKNWMVGRGADASRIRVCPINVDTKEWDPQRYDLPAIRKRLGVAAATTIIVFVGRIVEQKRPLLFARIIQRLATREANFMAFVVGEGEELPALKRFVRRQKLKRYVRFLGALPPRKVREVLAAGDMLVLPSKMEGVALALFECMAMETVPVAARVGGQAELVTPDCGYLIPHGDDEIGAYVEALTHLLHHPDYRQSLAKQGRKRVVEHFDLSAMLTTMQAAICQARDLAASRPGAAEDLAAARKSAAQFIEHARATDTFERLLSARTRRFPWSLARPLRVRLLPNGTRRFQRYKQVRLQVRALSRRLASRKSSRHHF